MAPTPGSKGLDHTDLAQIDPLDPAQLDATQAHYSLACPKDDLDEIYRHLWVAGSKGNISPLHHQLVLGRKIIRTTSPRLHLVWFDRTIRIQPLPCTLLNRHFFTSVVPPRPHLHATLPGFLWSYTLLIASPSDLNLARKLQLVDDTVTWPKWKKYHTALDESLKRGEPAQLKFKPRQSAQEYGRSGKDSRQLLCYSISSVRRETQRTTQPPSGRGNSGGVARRTDSAREIALHVALASKWKQVTVAMMSYVCAEASLVHPYQPTFVTGIPESKVVYTSLARSRVVWKATIALNQQVHAAYRGMSAIHHEIAVLHEEADRMDEDGNVN
ncbi:MAG: hypothetical protein M1829_002691 [Trizodia sp. TS-e1964]|nr:MAG: hypothetical protein M1829_002691 [Trizodia sp. TS-e1964]